MSLKNMFIGLALEGLMAQENYASRNEEKIQEAIDKWHKADSLPRKQKKKVRKEANYEYNFWIGIDKWEKENHFTF